MKRINLLRSSFLFLLFPFFLTSCGGNTTETPKEYSATNPRTIKEVNLDSEPVELVAPFTVLTETGETPEELEYKYQNLDENVFDNMYLAIRIAAENSTTKNKLQVQDANFTQIFIRQKASEYHLFDGDKYVGTDGSVPCKEYVASHKNAYAISGEGSGYKLLGRDDYVENMDLNETVLEYNAGAYNYMFTKSGVGMGENGTNLNGFSYASAIVRLSETKYKPTKDGDGWNAYIFLNVASQIHSDLGLIGILTGSKVEFRLFRNCNSTSHGGSGAGFYVYHDKIATASTSYDSATGEYYGMDDLKFEAIGLSNGFVFNVTNLRTNEVFSFEDLHYQADGVTPLVENSADNACYYRALVAASYCPVVGNVWNFECGAAMTNVLWENIMLARYNNDDISYYQSEDCLKYEFTPESEYFRDGYSQGAYASYHEFGVYEEDGTHPSGATYKKGQHYLSQSVDYNS